MFETAPQPSFGLHERVGENCAQQHGQRAEYQHERLGEVVGQQALAQFAAGLGAARQAGTQMEEIHQSSAAGERSSGAGGGTEGSAQVRPCTKSSLARSQCASARPSRRPSVSQSRKAKSAMTVSEGGWSHMPKLRPGSFHESSGPPPSARSSGRDCIRDAGSACRLRPWQCVTFDRRICHPTSWRRHPTSWLRRSWTCASCRRPRPAWARCRRLPPPPRSPRLRRGR